MMNAWLILMATTFAARHSKSQISNLSHQEITTGVTLPITTEETNQIPVRNFQFVPQKITMLNSNLTPKEPTVSLPTMMIWKTFMKIKKASNKQSTMLVSTTSMTTSQSICSQMKTLYQHSWWSHIAWMAELYFSKTVPLKLLLASQRRLFLLAQWFE